MKKIKILLVLSLASLMASAQTLLIQENFQDWKPEAGIAPIPPSKSPGGVEYSITKKLFDGKTDGTFTSNALIVSPEQSTGKQGKAEGNDNPSKGRIAIKGAKNYFQLPLLPSVGKIILKVNVGTDMKGFKLQASTGGAFEDIAGTETECSNEVTKAYTFNLNYSKPTTIRIVPTSGSSVYIWDLEVYSYSKK